MDIPRHVFIDTQCFIQNQLNLKNSSFNAFRELCSEGHFENVTTSIVVNEVKAWIIRQVKEEVTNLQKGTFLKRNLLADINFSIEEYTTSLIEKEFNLFLEYLEECKTINIDVTKTNISTILRSYFDNTPPFDNKNKKSEFPDAFNMQGIMEYLDENGIQNINIVSKDRDLINYCKEHNLELVQRDSLKYILDDYNRGQVSIGDSLNNFVLNKNFSHNLMNQLIKSLENFLEINEYYNVSGIDICSAIITDFSILSFGHSFVAVSAEVNCNSKAYADKTTDAIRKSCELEVNFISQFELEFKVENNKVLRLTDADCDGTTGTLINIVTLKQENNLSI